MVTHRSASWSRRAHDLFDACIWVFDVEGTLVDAVMPTLRCWRLIFDEFGHDVSLAELHRYSGMDGHDMLGKLLPHAPKREREEMIARQGARYREDFLADVPPLPGVQDLFEELKRRGARIALATDCQPDELKHYLAVAGITGMPDAIACGKDVRRGKPAPTLLEIALRRVRAGRRPALYVGDTPYDAMAARKAGIESIGVLTGHFAEAVLCEAGCREVFRDPAAIRDRLRHGVTTRSGGEVAAAV